MFYDEVEEAAGFLRGRIAEKKESTGEVPGAPQTGIVLGSGLGGLVEVMKDKVEVPYAEIPHFPLSSIKGHADKLIFGMIGKQQVVCMQGRFHYYEGLSMKQVTFPIYVLSLLGVKDLIVTNACGAISRSLEVGDLVLISDYLNLWGENPLIGENDERFGPRFPDMTEAYSKVLRALAREEASRLGIPLKEGVYALFSGPCYETAAEIRAYAALGADMIGMSTVPETIAANYLGMRVLGISVITNMATGIAREKHSHEEVLKAAEEAGGRLCALARGMLENR